MRGKYVGVRHSLGIAGDRSAQVSVWMLAVFRSIIDPHWDYEDRLRSCPVILPDWVPGQW